MFCKYCGNRLDDQAKFCPTCGKPVESAPSPAQDRPLRCPGCGSQISALDAVCPACGYEVRARSGISSMEEFRRAYDAIEGGDEDFLSSLKNFFSFKRTSSKAEKQASLISAFSVPCTKEDLHEFLLLSATHFDPEFLALTEPPDGMFLDDFNDEMLLQKAWFAKFQQVYETAKTSFRQDPHFQRFQEIYDEKMGEVQKRKKKPLIKKEFLIMAIMMLVLMIAMAVFGFATGFFKDDDAVPGQETVETETDGWEEQEDLTFGTKES